MATVNLVVTVRVQWWKLNTCLHIIKALYWLGLIDEDQAMDMGTKAAHRSVYVVINK